MAKNLVELYSSSGVLWKVELANEEDGYVGEEISKQSVERMAWLLLTASSKIVEERNDLKMEKLSKKKTELKDLKNYSLSILQKMRAVRV